MTTTALERSLANESTTNSLEERDMGLEPIGYTCIPHKASPERTIAPYKSGLAGPTATGGPRPSYAVYGHKFNSASKFTIHPMIFATGTPTGIFAGRSAHYATYGPLTYYYVRRTILLRRNVRVLCASGPIPLSASALYLRCYRCHSRSYNTSSYHLLLSILSCIVGRLQI